MIKCIQGLDASTAKYEYLERLVRKQSRKIQNLEKAVSLSLSRPQTSSSQSHLQSNEANTFMSPAAIAHSTGNSEMDTGTERNTLASQSTINAGSMEPHLVSEASVAFSQHTTSSSQLHLQSNQANTEVSQSNNSASTDNTSMNTSVDSIAIGPGQLLASSLQFGSASTAATNNVLSDPNAVITDALHTLYGFLTSIPSSVPAEISILNVSSEDVIAHIHSCFENVYNKGTKRNIATMQCGNCPFVMSVVNSVEDTQTSVSKVTVRWVRVHECTTAAPQFYLSTKSPNTILSRVKNQPSFTDSALAQDITEHWRQISG